MSPTIRFVSLGSGIGDGGFFCSHVANSCKLLIWFFETGATEVHQPYVKHVSICRNTKEEKKSVSLSRIESRVTKSMANFNGVFCRIGGPNLAKKKNGLPGPTDVATTCFFYLAQFPKDNGTFKQKQNKNMLWYCCSWFTNPAPPVAY